MHGGAAQRGEGSQRAKPNSPWQVAEGPVAALLCYLDEHDDVDQNEPRCKARFRMMLAEVQNPLETQLATDLTTWHQVALITKLSEITMCGS